ncbi:hypothetical protein F3J34_13790 [Klebsiella sp. Ap-873]|nr:hypothetical protein [Klebsiella sp. Ap-873]
MSGDWGLMVRGKTNVADASPLQFLRKIPRSEMNLQSGQSTNYDFTGQVPAGTQLVVFTDVAVEVLTSSIVLGVNTVPINITVNGLVVNISIPQWGTGSWNYPPPTWPLGFWVFAIYGQPARGDWGAWVNQGGAFPSVVNSDAGMFLTQKMSISFTGSYPINSSENALVFCSCTDASIGLVFDRADMTLKGYRPNGGNWGAQGGFTVPVNICVFDIKTPTIPDWGFWVKGRDGKIAFTSAETPLIIREWTTVPGYVGAMNGFSGVANGPMILPTHVGTKTTNKSDVWKCNLSTNGQGMGISSGAQLIHVGSNILNDVEVIAYAGKPIPVIWSSDYF